MKNDIVYRNPNGFIINVERNVRVHDDTDNADTLYIFDGNVPSIYRVSNKQECIGPPRDYTVYTLKGLMFDGWTITIYDCVDDKEI